MSLTRKALVVPIAAVAAGFVCAGAASAQDGARERGSGDRRQSAPLKSAPPARGAVPRLGAQAPQPLAQPSPAPRAQRVPPVQEAPRAQNGQRFQNGQAVQGVPGVAAGRVGSSTSYSRSTAPYRQQAPAQVAPQPRSYSGGSVPRSYGYQNHQGYSSYGYSSRPYGYSRESLWPRLRTSFYAPRFFYSASPYRPYYAFRPRLRLGFGIYIGYPVAYPVWYDPYLSTAYSWYRPGISYGGVSFDIQPVDAEIWVDGNYVGVVQDFGPYAAPLTLPAGPHHIDLQASGFGPMSFDITVVPRQVIPYQGTLPQG